MNAQFCSAVLFVRDMMASRYFYEQLLGQQIDMDLGINVGYVGGLSLWELEAVYDVVFHHAPDADMPLGCKNMEIYFEVDDLAALQDILVNAGANLVHPIAEQPWAQRTLRVYDPDGHLVELAEPMEVVVYRLVADGLDKDAICDRTAMPMWAIEQILSKGTVAKGED